MISVDFDFPDRPEILCIGAHCDDIEIGCSGTVLRLLDAHPDIHITWLILTGNADRQAEAKASAINLIGADRVELVFHGFRDGYLPYIGETVKEAFEEIKSRTDPHLILCHWEGDRHQDHRFISELTASTFRKNLILEYEIPKYDGDMGRPNVFVPITEDILKKKISNLMRCYPSQVDKNWFDAETFTSLHRLRGVECGSDSRYAEGFYCRKMAFMK